MTDLHSLLSQAADPEGTAPDGVVDADLVRGRRALLHRRMRRTGTRSALAAVVAIGAFAAVHPGGSSAGTTAAPATTTAKAPATANAPVTANASTKVKTTTKVKTVKLGVKLVAYTGTQPAGYTVGSVPAGWEIQGVNNDDLAIAPIGFADQSLSSWKGKLVVMLMSKDEKPPTDGTPVTVGVTGTGRISHSNPGPILTFKDSTGHWLVVQVPEELHWTDAQVVAFGNTVHATATAVAGEG